jgi:ribose transport system ATP-binding protein
VRIDDRTLPRGSVDSAVRAGIGLCPEERKSQGLVLDEAVYRNISLASLPRFSRMGRTRDGVERSAAHEAARSVDLRPDDPDRVTRTLSGGNQQKVLLARWLLRSCRVLILDEPTRGVDVGARSEIYALVRQLAEDGVAVVVVSSDIDEVLGLSDRILVVADGRVIHAGPSEEMDAHAVLDRILAVHESPDGESAGSASKGDAA